MAAGQTVKLVVAQAWMNGKLGLVIDGPNELGRYTVEVSGESEWFEFKADNLVAQGRRGRRQELESCFGESVD